MSEQLLKTYKNNCDTINDNDIKYKNLVNSLKDLEYIQKDLYSVIKTQNEKIKDINNKNDSIINNFNNSNRELELCDKYYISYKPIVIGSVVGAIFISPFTSLIGLKYLGLTSSIGMLIGGISGYKIQQ